MPCYVMQWKKAMKHDAMKCNVTKHTKKHQPMRRRKGGAAKLVVGETKESNATQNNAMQSKAMQHDAMHCKATQSDERQKNTTAYEVS